MFSVFTLALIPHTSLAGEERLEAFSLQVIENGYGRDVGVSVTT